MAAPRQGLYRGRVMHHRLRPIRHRFRHRVFALFLDVDRLAETGRRLRLFSYNRPNLLAFHDRDHGPRDGSPLRPWLDGLLRQAGLAPAGLRIFVLCYPRLLGYVFNPLTTYYAYDAAGTLGAVIYEVKNTFGEQHAYVMPARAADNGLVEQACNKVFYVSPFLAVDGRYRFALRAPDERLSMVIRLDGAEGPRLVASTSGRYRPLSDAALLRAWLAHPLMTFKVIAAIHWQALRLWLKGARHSPRPPAPRPAAAIDGPAEARQ